MRVRASTVAALVTLSVGAVPAARAGSQRPVPPNADALAGLAAGAERARGRSLSSTPPTRPVAPAPCASTVTCSPSPSSARSTRPSSSRSFPCSSGQIDRGENLEAIAAQVLDDSSFRPDRLAHGIYLSVHCQDEAALSDAGATTAEERAVDYLQLLAHNRRIERAQCRACEYDPTTLPNSYFFELPGMGHDVTTQMCPRHPAQRVPRRSERGTGAPLPG